MGLAVLPPTQFSELATLRPELMTSTPLWYYVLKEAAVVEDGRHLYVTSGVGTSRWPIRLRRPPEVVVLRLRSAAG